MVASDSNLLSIGHSNHDFDRFVRLLEQHAVEVVVDVRSQPYSRYASQFNRESLEQGLRSAGFRYLFLGQELGGRPEGSEFYDPEGHVLYDRLALSKQFIAGIERLERGAQKFCAALMCSEEDPSSCHRRLLIGRVLAGRGVELRHIRGDGRIETEADLLKTESPQISMFVQGQEEPWRSTRSVSPRRTPADSSRP